MDLLVKNLKWLSERPNEGSPQANVGDAAGVTQSAVSKITTGKTKEPGFRTIAGIARHFRVSLDDLAYRDLEQQGPSKASQAARLDTAKLVDLIETVEAAIQAAGVRVPAARRAKLIAQLYVDEQASQGARDVKSALISFLLTLGTTDESTSTR